MVHKGSPHHHHSKSPRHHSKSPRRTMKSPHMGCVHLEIDGKLVRKNFHSKESARAWAMRGKNSPGKMTFREVKEPRKFTPRAASPRRTKSPRRRTASPRRTKSPRGTKSPRRSMKSPRRTA
jgi:hypothetical protein